MMCGCMQKWGGGGVASGAGGLLASSCPRSTAASLVERSYRLGWVFFRAVVPVVGRAYSTPRAAYFPARVEASSFVVVLRVLSCPPTGAAHTGFLYFCGRPLVSWRAATTR